ncbi:TonB family protein [Sphingomonas sp. HITSZ_GF]|uniref:energy transducer TonB n=1 Tax=Sphingomonas sp. HITSZ_GF TaxID=3037247 RepID=UPI00240D5F2E|nr:energy transducer TonB [Sphingomonas sp. HITSZ_GF]MDG2533688.1 TonB family protein [Sphingomonas sp. HITSZ_GF]
MSLYAASGYQPRKPRAASLGAAFLINGAIIAGMIYSAPDFVKKVLPGSMDTYNVPDLPPPPPIEPPKEQPKVEQKAATQPLPNIPDPIVPTQIERTIESTTIIPERLPEITKPVETGPVTRVEPKVEPVPPLVGARRDPRYAEDFQPPYPTAKLRSQEDGRVSVKVLVGADGRVKAVEQLSATSQDFFEATRRQALSKWRFKPASRGGVAEESWMTLSVTFRIQDQ